MRKITIGTVSEGTLRSEDLIPVFLGEIEQLMKEYIDADQDVVLAQSIISEGKEIMSKYEQEESIDEEVASEVCTELMDTLNSLCPAYIYFGSLEGDGSDFGFWPDWESIRRDMEEGEVVESGKNGECVVVNDGTRFEVNDHGNITITAIETGKVILSIV